MPTTTPHTAPRRILFLTPQLPYPPEQGAALRNYSLICQVAQRHAVSLLTFAAHDAAVRGPLHALCQQVRTVPPPGRTRVDRLRTLALTRLPDMAQRLHSPAFVAALRDMVTREPFDVLQVEGIEMAPYARLVRQWLSENAPVLVFDGSAEYVLQQRACLADARRPHGGRPPSIRGAVAAPEPDGPSAARLTWWSPCPRRTPSPCADSMRRSGRW